MAERDSQVWFNGTFMPAGAARLPVTDHAVQYGAGLFETFRTWDGRAPFLSRHLARLRAGCAQYRIAPPAGALLPQAEQGLPSILRELLARNGWSDAVFRYTVTAGEAPPGLPAEPYRHPSEIITLRRLPAAPAGGWSLHVLRTPRLPPEHFPRPKSLQFANGLAGRWEALDRGLGIGTEGLMLTTDGMVAEGVTSNVFLQIGDALCTPALELGVLPGVMRGLALKWARDDGIAVREGMFPVATLKHAGMVILTSAVVGIAPVSRILDESDHALAEPATAAHPWFRLLHARLQQALGAGAAPIGA